jgi:hypothetical protein
MLVGALLAAVYAMITVSEFGLAAYCLWYYTKVRITAFVLLVMVPLQVLFIRHGERLLSSFHTPSSFDPMTDGLAVFFEYMALKATLVLLCLGLSLRLAWCLLFGEQEPERIC